MSEIVFMCESTLKRSTKRDVTLLQRNEEHEVANGIMKSTKNNFQEINQSNFLHKRIKLLSQTLGLLKMRVKHTGRSVSVGTEIRIIFKHRRWRGVPPTEHRGKQDLPLQDEKYEYSTFEKPENTITYDYKGNGAQLHRLRF